MEPLFQPIGEPYTALALVLGFTIAINCVLHRLALLLLLLLLLLGAMPPGVFDTLFDWGVPRAVKIDEA
jgi:hypothetical protein